MAHKGSPSSPPVYLQGFLSGSCVSVLAVITEEETDAGLKPPFTDEAAVTLFKARESEGGKVEGRVFGCLEADEQKQAANQAGSLLDSRFS